jgi:anti-sigma B factor antagonist
VSTWLEVTRMSQTHAHPDIEHAGVTRTGDPRTGHEPSEVIRLATYRAEDDEHRVTPMENAESCTHRIANKVTVARQHVTSARQGDETQLRIEGALDACTIDEISPILDAAVADHPRRVTVDLDELTILDSMGVGAIVSLWKRVKAQGGKVVVVRAHAQPLLVLKLLRLDAIFGM